MNISSGIASLVDLERYPLDRPGTPAWQALVDDCRRQHEAVGAANLQGFVRPAAVAPLAAEANRLLQRGYQKTHYRSAFFRDDDPSLPADHPRRRMWVEGSLQLADDQIGPDTLIRAIYAWDPLTEFIAAVEERAALYRMADEFQALNIIAHGEGEQLPWHFDVNDFTITLLLQAPVAGGAFVYAPELRRDGEPDYDAIRAIFEGDMGRVRSLPRLAGTLTLFRGRNHFHAVTPVEGTVPRVTAILTYDEKPDCVSTERGNTFIYGPRVAEIYRRRREAAAAA